MLQTWRSLTFLHWAYEPAVIRRLLPEGLELDTFDGAAWVGLAPFLLVNLRVPTLPAFPWVSHFPETNVRTYVRGQDGKRGVWFFTLEADRLLAVLGARAFYHLPYRWARMRVEEKAGIVKYHSERSWPFGAGHSSVSVRPGERMGVGPLDNFLTVRYRLFSAAGNRIYHADIEHKPWPLRHAEVEEFEGDLIERSGVPKPTGKPVVHFSQDLDVRVGWLTASGIKP